VSKLRNAPYPTGRSKAWVKVKCIFRQEFVIAGYVRSNVSARAIGSLVLGYYRDGKLVYAGRVGTGFTAKTAVDLYRLLEAIRTPGNPFAKKLSRAEARGVFFGQPELVAEVEFRAWTTDRIVRHASFLGLRDDKQAAEVGLEAS
jgi:bifunctional non-homologous end joining protein LigD